MQTQWGRKETIIFPPHSPLYSYGAIFVSLTLTALFLYLHFAIAMLPLQRFYLPYYFRTAVAGVVHRTDKYEMLMVADGAKRSRAARDSDVIAGSTAQMGEKPLPLQLSDSGERLVSCFCTVDQRRNTSISLFITTFRARCTT